MLPNPIEIQGELELFAVSLPVFEGPFDLLLSLIARHKLDVTEVALARVTDEFIVFTKAFPDLSRTTEFLVVAAPLLDMKAAHLLPRLDEQDNTSDADLEVRDLLFSRLLQYRAFKEASKDIGARLAASSSYVPRDVPLEAHLASVLPELTWFTTREDLARLAAHALCASPPTVQVAHLHDPVVPVREQVLVVADKLASVGEMSFRELVADAATRAVIVSRFLALLELFRRGAVEFVQEGALGTLTIRWRAEVDASDIDIDEARRGARTEDTPAAAGATASSTGENTRTVEGDGDDD